MTEYREPRRLVVPYWRIRSMTVLEQARACVVANVAEGRARQLMRAYIAHELEPDEMLLAATLFYANAYELELRRDPTLTWEELQTWAVSVDMAAVDPMLEAEAAARVNAAIATGLPPAVAGELTVAEVSAYESIREEASRSARRRRARVHR